MAEVETVAIQNERGETRQYETVASRVFRFREKYPEAQIFTVLVALDDDKAIVRCEIYLPFMNPATSVLDWRMVSCGHAEEYRLDGTINQTSALENCETSAVGRALSFFGFGSVNSIASADEVIGAKKRQASAEKHAPGALIILQNAAKGGIEALEIAWTEELSKDDRVACKSYMPQLKRDAAKVKP